MYVSEHEASAEGEDVKEEMLEVLEWFLTQETFT